MIRYEGPAKGTRDARDALLADGIAIMGMGLGEKVALGHHGRFSGGTAARVSVMSARGSRRALDLIAALKNGDIIEDQSFSLTHTQRQIIPDQEVENSPQRTPAVCSKH